MAGRRALWWASAGAAVGALTLHDGTRDAVTGFGALAVRNSQTTVAAGRVAWLYKVHYPKGERRGRHALPAVRLGRACALLFSLSRALRRGVMSACGWGTTEQRDGRRSRRCRPAARGWRRVAEQGLLLLRGMPGCAPADVGVSVMFGVCHAGYDMTDACRAAR